MLTEVETESHMMKCSVFMSWHTSFQVLAGTFRAFLTFWFLQGMPEIIDLARTNLVEAIKFSYPQILSYDTTFQMGDFCVSVLVMRNTSLVNDPVFPVGFMMHERKFMHAAS